MQKILTIASLVLSAFIFFPLTAFADCDDIGSDPDFQKGFKELIKIYESGDYEKTIEAAKPLFAKCKESPAVLYYTGLAFKGQGNIDTAKLYIQKASEALSKYSAEPGISRKIWFDRYEIEHPESTVEAVKARKVMIDALTTQVGEVNSQMDEMRQQMDAVKADKDAYVQKTHDLELAVVSSGDVTRYKDMMWTGAGLGIGGIAVAIVGGAVFAKNNSKLEIDDFEFKYKNNDPETKKITGITGTPNNFYRDLGIGLLSAGIGMTIVGAVMAGINGYYYSNLIEKDADGKVSFNAGLSSFELNVKF